MAIAALYDIHGNLPALQAVLSEIERENEATNIVVGGDVLWGPMQSECLAVLRRVDASFIAGNCERDVLHPHSDVDKWCRDRLESADLPWIDRWPSTMSIEADGLGAILFCHATPGDIEGIVTAATPDEDVEREIAPFDADVVVCGHTHVQFDRRLRNGRRVINPGSVGLPYEQSPGAYWALLGRDVEMRHTEYDTEGALATFAAAGFPDSGPTDRWFDGIFGRSLRAEIPPAEATSFFELRRAGCG